MKWSKFSKVQKQNILKDTHWQRTGRAIWMLYMWFTFKNEMYLKIHIEKEQAEPFKCCTCDLLSKWCFEKHRRNICLWTETSVSMCCLKTFDIESLLIPTICYLTHKSFTDVAIFATPHWRNSVACCENWNICFQFHDLRWSRHIWM